MEEHLDRSVSAVRPRISNSSGWSTGGVQISRETTGFEHITLREALHCANESTHELQASEVFGDGYLLVHHPLFARIRRDVLGLGFKISPEKSLDYLLFSFGFLDEMYARKEIVSIKNEHIFRKIEISSPGIITAGSLGRCGPHLNFIAHESCHMTARSIVSFQLRNKYENKTVFESLLEESFANLTEDLLWLTAQTDPMVSVFLHFNTYRRNFSTDDKENFATAFEQLGATPVMHFALLGYLIANFGYYRATWEHVEMLAELSIPGGTVTETGRRSLYAILSNCLRLNKAFVYETSQIYFNMRGLNGTIKELTDFDPFALLRDGEVAQTVRSLAAYLSGELSTSQLTSE